MNIYPIFSLCSPPKFYDLIFFNFAISTAHLRLMIVPGIQSRTLEPQAQKSFTSPLSYLPKTPQLLKNILFYFNETDCTNMLDHCSTLDYGGAGDWMWDFGISDMKVLLNNYNAISSDLRVLYSVLCQWAFKLIPLF